MANNTFHGIIVYEILDNGNILNGIYSNTENVDKKYFEIDNEIARKEDTGDTDIIGVYQARYIQSSTPKTVIHCTLEIIKNGPVYSFKWIDKKGKLIFSGLGIKTNNNQIAVSYIDG